MSVIKIENSNLEMVDSIFINNHFLGSLLDLRNNNDTIFVSNCFFIKNKLRNGFLVNLNTNAEFTKNIVSGT